MPQQRVHTTGLLRSIADTAGEFQIVALPSRVVIDIATRNYDVCGHLYKDHALATLSVATAIRLRDLLDEAIVDASDAPPHHPGLWSESTTRAIAHRGGRRRAA